MTTALQASSQALIDAIHRGPDLRGDPSTILDLLAERRRIDLTDLRPAAQADLIARRARALLPSHDALTAALGIGRPLVVKFGIDPTAADVHVGHAVPMILAARLQRMGHRVVLIVGDLTARIGDPSGRSADRAPLTDADIAANLATYRTQIAPFVNFERAEFRLNRDWLDRITLPEFLGVLQRLPVSAALQRDDFRRRLDAGSGLSLAELVYSVVMALDSVEIGADIELGGIDQLLNMQMCRRVMGNHGQPPEIVVATPLIEGTDGSGAKMSKSNRNAVGLARDPAGIFGAFMSIPDRLVPGYLAALTELLDPEIALLTSAHPMAVKTLLAGDVTATIHGTAAAAEAGAAFTAQFSRRQFSDLPSVPAIMRSDLGAATVADLFVTLTGLVVSANQVRRVAAGGGLRLIHERSGYPQARVTLTEAQANAVAAEMVPAGDGRTFVKCGRAVVEVK